jgi:cell division protease FtsH
MKLKPFTAWPLWSQVIAILAGTVGFIAFLVVLQYQADVPSTAEKTPLARHFEATPRAWLSNPRDVSEFERTLGQHNMKEAGVDQRYVFVTTKTGERYSTQLLSDRDGLRSRLEALSREHGFALTRIAVDDRDFRQKATDATGIVLEKMLKILSVAASLLIGVYLIQQMGMGKNTTKLAEKPDTSFEDVIGASEAKAALQQVTAFMKDPQKYVALGAKPPRGVLLEGPPGTGKTMLARALAGECGANFIAVDGSYFSSMFYGVGIMKVKELFQTARKNAPCIIFIDEFDGIGKRSSGPKVSAGVSEENRIINKLLVEMDGFSESDNIVVIGATNHVGNIDDALKRPGRFDLVARVTLPNVQDRRELFKRCLKRVKSEDVVDVESLGRASIGLSHADITNIVNRATVLAAERGAAAVAEEHLHRALESHQLGGEVSSMKSLITQDARIRIAVHEAGHALVGHVLKAGKVERVSIEPRGQALGVTFVTRDNEVPLYGEQELHGRLSMLLAGREAELMQFGNTTSGASDDLKRASELAIEMVSAMGFSREFGLLSLKGVPDNLIGPHIQERVLDEARAMLEEAQRICRNSLRQHRASLDALTQELLREETVAGDVLARFLPQDTALQLEAPALAA